jgi:hypothetical protein
LKDLSAEEGELLFSNFHSLALFTASISHFDIFVVTSLTIGDIRVFLKLACPNPRE